MLQRYVVEALGLIVAVYLLQAFVEKGGKLGDALRFFRELDEPLVTAFGVAVHVYGCRRVFGYLCPGFLASILQSFLGIVHDEFLAEGIDKILRTARNDKLVRVLAGKHHGVAYHVPPQSAGGGNDHGVVLACLHAPQGHYGRVVRTELVHRYKLVEHVIVYHERHGFVCRVVLQSEESLAGIVGLHVVHTGRRDELLVLLAVRGKGYTAMEEHLQVGPHLFQVVLAAEFHHPYQNTEHPARHTRNVGDVLVHCLAGYAVALHLKVAQQCCLLARYAHQIGQRIDVLYQYGTEVAHQTARHVIVGRMASAEDKALSVENAALGVVAQIIRYRIKSSGIVYAVQAVAGNGYKLTLVVGGTRRLGVPLYNARPQDVLLAVPHPVYVTFQFLVGVYRYILRELTVTVGGVEQMFHSVFRVLAFAYEAHQHIVLYLFRLVEVSLQGFLPWLEHMAHYRCQTHFLLLFVKAHFRCGLQTCSVPLVRKTALKCKISLNFSYTESFYVFLVLGNLRATVKTQIACTCPSHYQNKIELTCE